MSWTQNKLVLAVAGALSLAACGGGGSNGGMSADAPIVDVAKYVVVATDGEGYINFIGDDGASRVELIDAIRPLNANSQPYGLGEVHFTHDGKKALVVISSGFLDDAGNATGGGLAIVDVATRKLDKLVALKNTKISDGSGAMPVTRIVHTYMDGEYMWLNNDGPSSPDPLAGLPDSTFRVHVHCDDVASAECGGEINEIVVGNGHKKSAISETPKRFATHNLTDQTISVIDDDPTSPTFLTVLGGPGDQPYTADLKTADTIFDATLNNGAGGTRAKKNTPHGMAYSPVSGKFYAGITPGEDMAVAVVDATTLALTSIAAGSADEGKIPAGGYMHAIAEGDWVVMVGYKAGHGYLSVIDASTDSVADVVDLGDLKSSSFDTFEASAMAHHADGAEETMVVVPGASGATLQDKIAVVHIDNTTGKAVLNNNGAPDVHYIDVGYAPSHRNGGITGGGERAYYPNTCPPAAAPASGTTTHHALADAGCNSIAAVNLVDHHAAPILVNTTGQNPSGIGIVQPGVGPSH
jgi:hypothetical protein